MSGGNGQRAHRAHAAPCQTLTPLPRCRRPARSAAQLADTRQLGQGEGAASFLCVPVVPEPALATNRAAIAALLLAYPSSSAAPQE